MQIDTVIRVLVKHGDPLVAAGVAAALRQQPDIQVHMHESEPAAHLPFDVLVADLDGALACLANERERLAGRSCRVLVLTPNGGERDVRVALEAGVHGYQLLGCRLDELVTGVRTVARGSRYLGDGVAVRMAESLAHEALTRREADVLQLMACGYCNKSIANELDIAVGTVKAHVKAILSKLDARTRTHAAAVASERGLVARRSAALH